MILCMLGSYITNKRIVFDVLYAFATLCISIERKGRELSNACAIRYKYGSMCVYVALDVSVFTLIFKESQPDFHFEFVHTCVYFYMKRECHRDSKRMRQIAFCLNSSYILLELRQCFTISFHKYYNLRISTKIGKKQTVVITIANVIIATVTATLLLPFSFLSFPKLQRIQSLFFITHFDGFNFYRVFYFLSSLTLSFQLFVAIMLNIPLYFLFSCFFSIFILFYFSLETLLNRFVIRVRHQKYFGKIKRSYRHIFFVHLIICEYIKFKNILKKNEIKIQTAQKVLGKLIL